jgi:hypothetical protein
MPYEIVETELYHSPPKSRKMNILYANKSNADLKCGYYYNKVPINNYIHSPLFGNLEYDDITRVYRDEPIIPLTDGVIYNRSYTDTDKIIELKILYK